MKSNQLIYKNKNLYDVVENIFKNYNKVFIHPIYLINNPKLYGPLIIIENPNFDNSKLEIVENTIYIKEHTFTGLRGTLSLDTSSYINNSIFKKKILEFLSIFSGRLFELRNKYIYKYLPSPNSYVKNFFDNCCGFNLKALLNIENIDSLPYKYLFNKNKNIYNLQKVLEIYTKEIIIINKNSYLNKYEIFQQNKKLGEIYLSKNIFIISLLIKIQVNSYVKLENLLKSENYIKYIIDYYTEKYTIKYYIKKEKILLKSYVLSRKINFI